MDSPLRKIIDSSFIKNPICILNELSSKTNSKFSFEFQSTEDGFKALVIYRNKIIGTGKDKKKQAAKTKAAEEAVNFLSGCKKEEQVEETLNEFPKGELKLSCIVPQFFYEYFLDGNLIAEAHSLSEQQAKRRCVIKALNQLKSLSPRSSSKEEEVCKKVKIDNLDETCSKLDFFIEEKLRSSQLTDQEKSEVLEIEKEVDLINKHLKVFLKPIGSYSFGVPRRSKLEIDYCMVISKINQKKILNFYESLEKARLSYMGVKETKDCLKITYVPMLINSDQPWPFVKLLKDQYAYNVFFYESDDHPSLLHFTKMKLESKLKKDVSNWLRHWRQARSLSLPIEIFDILVTETVKDEHCLTDALRAVLECLSGGVLLKGSTALISDMSFKYFLEKLDLEKVYKVTREAQDFLICLSKGDLKSYFD